jgi:diguanylate cyclase (GGDEF)-like protein
MNKEPAQYTVLIVDDDNITRRMIVKSLKKEGYNTIDTNNGVSAIEICRKEKPDLVLLDVMMPGLNGYDTCEQMRQIANTETLPIAMLTGTNDLESIDHAYDVGATDFITKPVQWNLLNQRIKYALRNKELHQQFLANTIRLQQSQKIARLGYWEVSAEKELYLSNEAKKLISLNNNQEFNIDDLNGALFTDMSNKLMDFIDNGLEQKSGFSQEFMFPNNEGIQYLLISGEYICDTYTKKCKLVGTFQDITPYKTATNLIHYQTYYDGLTGLPNRKLFNQKLESAIKNSDETETLLTVAIITIDNFKKINDTHGHEAGDEILNTLANRLQSINDHDLVVARFSSHVFSIMATGITHIDQSDHLTDSILEQGRQPFIADGVEFHLTLSIGVSMYPLESDTAQELIKGADTAMHYSRHAGGDQANYATQNMNKHNQDRLSLEHDLRQALALNQFELYYQPQICANTEKLIGAEALIRWHHPERGFVRPDIFIGVAEEMGIIKEIGLWVFEQASLQAKKWYDEGLGKIRIGINMSSVQFEDPQLLDKIKASIKETKVLPELLDIEITESIAVGNFDHINAILEELQQMGMHTSMDDFGTGYSSLSYLQKMSLDTLKVDRAFVKDIDENGENGSIAIAILAMAHSLGMNVIGEGVEHIHQLNFLREHGCEEIQGFYYSQPLPAGEFITWIHKHHAQAA